MKNKYQEALQNLYDMRSKLIDVSSKNTQWANNIKIYDFIGDQLRTLQELVDKMKPIEEDLGCPLEVVFKILKERNYYFEYNGKVYYNKKCYINTVNVNDGFISVSVSNEELRNKYIFDVKLFFNEHKKTWWLSKTKEE